MLSRNRFVQELNALKTEYRINNPWAQNFFQWNDEAVMARYIEAAYRLYMAAARNELKLVVLGDTEIRSMSVLMKNFGLLSANGLQEQADRAKVERTERFRDEYRSVRHGYPEVLGPGSILSDKMWTPILNDAMMIGAIQGRQPFYIALNTSEQAVWNKYGFDYTRVSEHAAKFGTQVNRATSNLDVYQRQWLNFFKQQPHMIWRGGFPRVLARELLALKFFGYGPVFSKTGLGFENGRRNSIGLPGFRAYNNALMRVGFFANDKQRVVGAISEFLFDDASLLRI